MYQDYALIKKSTLSETANAIRVQKGTTDTIDPANFGSEIMAIKSSVVEPILQEKTTTENGEVVPDEGYDGLSKVVVNVPTGTSVPGGYTVNFYDNNELIESISSKCGISIDEPLYSKHGVWNNINGDETVFPITYDTANITDLYFRESTFVNDFYTYFGIDKNIYSYLYIVSWYANSTTWRIKPIFCQSFFSYNAYMLTGCLVLNGNNYRDITITADEYANTTYYADPVLIFETLKTTDNPVFNINMSNYTPDNDTNKCWYYTNYDTKAHTNWTDLRKV